MQGISPDFPFLKWPGDREMGNQIVNRKQFVWVFISMVPFLSLGKNQRAYAPEFRLQKERRQESD